MNIVFRNEKGRMTIDKTMQLVAGVDAYNSRIDLASQPVIDYVSVAMPGRACAIFLTAGTVGSATEGSATKGSARHGGLSLQLNGHTLRMFFHIPLAPCTPHDISCWSYSPRSADRSRPRLSKI